MAAKRSATGKNTPTGKSKTGKAPAKRPSTARTRKTTIRAEAEKVIDPKTGKAPAKPDSRQSSPMEKALRDMRILQWKAEGMSVVDIVARDGRSRRAITDVLNLYETRGVPDGANLLERRPGEILEGAMNRWSLLYDALFEMACSGKQETVRLGAIKHMIDIDVKRIDTLQTLGVLPKNLGVVRHLHDIEGLARRMLEAIDSFAAGKIDRPGLQEVFYEAAGLPAPEPPVDGTAEETAA